MPYQRIILFYGLLLAFTQCVSKQQILEKSVFSLHKQLMALHDSTMAQYGVSGHLAELLKKKSSSIDAPTLTLIDSIRTELDGSNEYMMDWMANYKEPETKDSVAFIYLGQQIELLKKFANHQSQIIRQANLILNQSTH